MSFLLFKSKPKHKISLVNDRRSFYDNHKWTNDDELQQQQSMNTQTPTGTSPKLFKSERSINLNSSPPQPTTNSQHERDDFDDLLDLTHRVPRKQVKKEAASSNECLLPNNNGCTSSRQAGINGGGGSTPTGKVYSNSVSANGRKSASANKLSSSLPPLPPLPYSFVKLER